jgi:rod shape-determining protein MreD
MRWLFPVFAGVLSLLLQAGLASRMAIGSVSPDFVTICVVMYGVQRGPIHGALFGFFIGLAVDLGDPGFLGLNALAKTVVGFAAGRMGGSAAGGVAVLFTVFLVAAFVHDGVYQIVYLWPRMGGALLSLVTVALPCALYTAVVGIAVDRILVLLGARVVTSIGKERR